MSINFGKLNRALKADQIVFLENGELVERFKTAREIAGSDDPRQLRRAKALRNLILLDMVSEKEAEEDEKNYKALLSII